VLELSVRSTLPHNGPAVVLQLASRCRAPSRRHHCHTTRVGHGPGPAIPHGCFRGRRYNGRHARHDSIARRHIRGLWEQWEDVPRRSLEAIAVEAYRSSALTESQIRRLPGLGSRFEVHVLRKAHRVPLCTVVDLDDDVRVQRELGTLPTGDRRARRSVTASPSIVPWLE
jgi:hypothetical protein